MKFKLQFHKNEVVSFVGKKKKKSGNVLYSLVLEVPTQNPQCCLLVCSAKDSYYTTLDSKRFLINELSETWK